MNGAESHNDFWRVGHGNAEWMFGTRNVPCFWLDNGVAHGCPEQTRLQLDDWGSISTDSLRIEQRLCPLVGLASPSVGWIVPDQSADSTKTDGNKAESQTADPDSTRTAAQESGRVQRVDNYRLLQEIGEGGMGEVFLAEQEKPIRRRVALKLIKAGMDTRQVIARFESERQALALMDHPCIAKVFDADSTSEGRPYFAMEYVKGEPITAYCDRHRLTTRERLDLFMQVCDGVQHAHHKGIIHRDIKPSNVLVAIQDEKPVPKIIDFGVAKATEQRLTEKTVFTQMGVLVGTPEYMSPEQAEMTGLDIDTRTDVYSLGVLLYELLVGALPFDPRELRKGGFDELRHKIREEEPSKPSTRVSTLGGATRDIANRRRTDLPALRRDLRGDLDWITMKALEKDRTRRYGSPNDLAADVGHHLRHEPVQASPPSTAYRVGKFARRHRLGVVATVAVVLAVVAGISATTIGLVRATRAKTEAKRETATAEQVSEFLVGLFEVSDPSEARGNSISAREVLDRGAERIEAALADQPAIQARMMSKVGQVYQNLGLYEQAEPLLRRALEIRRHVLGPDHHETLHSLNRIGSLCWRKGQLDEAERYHGEALERARRVLGDDHPDTFNYVNNLGTVLEAQGKLDEAELYYREALEGRRRVLGDDHSATLVSRSNLGLALVNQGKLDEAEPYTREALEDKRRTLGDDHPATLASINNMGHLLEAQGKLDQAEPYYREALETNRRVLGDDHPLTLESISNMGYLINVQGKLGRG